MNIIKVLTKDGSSTLYVPELNEHYHSINGAIQESLHVFINEGLKFINKTRINILEIGFGTGLNAALTYKYAKEKNINIYYETVEKYPLDFDIIKDLKFKDIDEKIFKSIHQSEWEEDELISDFFKLKKNQIDLKDYNPNNSFDLIYFDAFAPDKQPKLWTEDIFKRLYQCMNNEGILTTYSSKGTVKQALRNAGFNLKRIPGPAGKRHMLRAQKIN